MYGSIYMSIEVITDTTGKCKDGFYADSIVNLCSIIITRENVASRSLM